MGGEIVRVLKLGVDLAFAFEVDGTTEMWVGLLNQMRRKDNILMNTPILLDAAKEEGVALVCTWFQQSGDLFEHNAVVDLKSYPAWSCMGVVDLVVVDQPLGDESNGGTAQLYYRFENAGDCAKFIAALEFTLPRPAPETYGGPSQPAPVGQGSATASKSAKPSKRHQAQKRTTGLNDKPDLRTVIRAPGKRHATKIIHF